jgi:predicted phosphodiesterase
MTNIIPLHLLKILDNEILTIDWDVVPKQTYARAFYNKYHSDFTASDTRCIQAIRSKIRLMTGNNGDENRNLANPLIAQDPKQGLDRLSKFTKQGIETAEKDFILPNELKKVLLLSDIHFPYHDLGALHTSIDYGIKNGIDCIYLNGDIVDFYQISRWDKDSSRMRMEDEKMLLIEFLLWIKELNVPIYYKYGNHEARWELYMMRNVKEFLHDSYFKLESYLGFEEIGIEHIKSRTLAKFGNLNVIHGHEFGESIFSPVNPARGLFLKGKANTIAGHNHQTSHHTESDLNGKQTGCWSTGCLCSMKPEYRPFAFTKWNHGAAIVEIDNDMDFHVTNFRVKNNKVY